MLLSTQNMLFQKKDVKFFLSKYKHFDPSLEHQRLVHDFQNEINVIPYLGDSKHAYRKRVHF